MRTSQENIKSCFCKSALCLKNLLKENRLSLEISPLALPPHTEHLSLLKEPLVKHLRWKFFLPLIHDLFWVMRSTENCYTVLRQVCIWLNMWDVEIILQILIPNSTIYWSALWANSLNSFSSVSSAPAILDYYEDWTTDKHWNKFRLESLPNQKA